MTLELEKHEALFLIEILESASDGAEEEETRMDLLERLDELVQSED